MWVIPDMISLRTRYINRSMHDTDPGLGFYLVVSAVVEDFASQI